MRIVSGKFVVAMLLTAMCLGASFVEAAAPGKGKNENDGKNDGKNGSVTVSEVELKAKLAGAGTQTAATGYAESGIVTVTNKTTKVTTTNSSLTVSVKGLTLADGAVVSFNLNGTAIGTGTVKSGSASIRLSTKSGNTVPAVNTGDTLTVVDPDGTTTDLTGAFGAATTDSEDSGH